MDNFEVLYETYLPKFKTYANKQNILEEEDAIQEQMIILINCIKSYDNNQCTFNTYLWKKIKSHFTYLRRYNNAKKRYAEVISYDDTRNNFIQ